VNGHRVIRAVSIIALVVLILGWMMLNAMTVMPVRAGDATVDAALFALQQATARAQETRSAQQTEVANQRGTATAIRQQALDKIADDNLHAQQTTTKRESDARLTQQAVQLEQTRAALTSVALTASAQISQTLIAQTKTRMADEAHWTETRRVGDATSTAVARQQNQDELSNQLYQSGLILGFVFVAIIIGMIVVALGILGYRWVTRPQPIPPAPSIEPPKPKIIVIPLPTPRIVDDPEAIEEITRALQAQEEQNGTLSHNEFPNDDPHTIDVTPKFVK
jgi:hypothetical protein